MMSVNSSVDQPLSGHFLHQLSLFRRTLPVSFSLLLLALSGIANAATNVETPQTKLPDQDWPTYGNNPGSSKYSSLDEITLANTANLKVVWRWASADNALVEQDPKLTPWNYKVTPIMVDGVLYVSTSLGQVAALDAVTGRQLWLYDTKTWVHGRPTNLGFNHRGVAYWNNDNGARVFMPTNDGRLLSLDARTGQPDPAFGNSGVIDLTKGLGARSIERNTRWLQRPWW